MASVLILGATSTIARALAAEFGRHHYDLTLAGRDREEMDALAADLALRFGVEARVRFFDALAFETHQPDLESWLSEERDAIEGAVVCFGYLSYTS